MLQSNSHEDPTVPNTWTEQTWQILPEPENTGDPRERNPDSSVSAQYEDHVLPDNSWQHEEDS